MSSALTPGILPTGEPVTAVQPQAEPQLGVETPRKFMGKYNDEAEAERGMHELINHNKELQAQLAAVIQMSQNRPNPAEVREARPDPWTRVQNEAALPVDPVREAVQFEIQRGVAKYIQENVDPQFAAMDARAKITQLHPDFERVAPDAEQYIGSNPTYSAMYNDMIQRGNILGAMDWAVTRFKLDRATNPVTPAPRTLADRAAATLPNNVPARIAPGVGQGDDVDKQAKADALGRGDLRAWSSMVTKGMPLTYNENLAAMIADQLAARGQG